jgi:hypothetical protein
MREIWEEMVGIEVSYREAKKEFALLKTNKVVESSWNSGTASNEARKKRDVKSAKD